MTKLYELTGKYLELSTLADDPDMPEDALTDTLEALEGEIEVKAQALLQVVAMIEGEAVAAETEAKRINAIAKVKRNRMDRMREYLRQNMLATGINKISCPLFNITLAKPRPMVVINNEAEIPHQYIKTTVTKTPIKKDILAALKRQRIVPGCALGESKRALLIK